MLQYSSLTNMELVFIFTFRAFLSAILESCINTLQQLFFPWQSADRAERKKLHLCIPNTDSTGSFLQSVLS